MTALNVFAGHTFVGQLTESETQGLCLYFMD